MKILSNKTAILAFIAFCVAAYVVINQSAPWVLIGIYWSLVTAKYFEDLNKDGQND